MERSLLVCALDVLRQTWLSPKAHLIKYINMTLYIADDVHTSHFKKRKEKGSPIFCSSALCTHSSSVFLLPLWFPVPFLFKPQLTLIQLSCPHHLTKTAQAKINNNLRVFKRAFPPSILLVLAAVHDILTTSIIQNQTPPDFGALPT